MCEMRYIEASAKTGENVKFLFEKLAKEIVIEEQK